MFNYQLCRWYDPYPRLAFAFKLLSLAPTTVQTRASKELLRVVSEEWGESKAAEIESQVTNKASTSSKRDYDEAEGATKTVAILKNSPAFIKSRVANALLNILMESP